MAARHVVSFDVNAESAVFYSNGFDVYRLVDGDWHRVAQGTLIETLCIA